MRETEKTQAQTTRQDFVLKTTFTPEDFTSLSLVSSSIVRTCNLYKSRNLVGKERDTDTQD